MKIRWSPEAAADFAALVEYIRKENSSAADRVAHSIYDGIVSLTSFPNRGRVGRVKDTRELVLPSLPFIAVYPSHEELRGVEIARVLHGSQRWPLTPAGK
jgi:toxin ParE1/3/4